MWIGKAATRRRKGGSNMNRHRGKGALVALALLAAGCGGASSPEGGDPPDLTGLEQQTLVVQMDQNGDNELDLLTLDISESPFVILECLYGVPGGDFVDATPSVRGLPMDPSISGALAIHMGDSLDVGSRTELDCTNAAGDPVKVVVFE
jgi:hypothetical protein